MKTVNLLSNVLRKRRSESGKLPFYPLNYGGTYEREK
jgi:hypothetical protein